MLSLWLLLPGLTLGMVLFNLLTWPRARATGTKLPRLSVCIPARNEAANIEACLAAIVRSRDLYEEILVYDDHSTDETRPILDRWAQSTPELRVLDGAPLPEGWVGKPHACHRLAEAAKGEHLLFLDADVRLEPDGLTKLMGLFADHHAQVLTAVPRQQTGSFMERLVLPLLHLTYAAWFPLVLVSRSRDPRFLAANGQVLLVGAEAYRRIGGFEAVRGAIVDDMAFCRVAKKTGLRVVFGDGFEVARCRMYGSAREVWRGFSKNLYEGIGGRPIALAVVTVLHLFAFVVPYGLLLVPSLTKVGALGVLANLVARAALAVRFRQPLEGVLLHPISVLVLLGILFNSFAWSRRGRIIWRDRVYPGGSSGAEAPP